VIASLPVVPSTEYANVPAFPLVNVSVAVPASVATTCVGSKGTASNAGPVVRHGVPLQVPGAIRGAVAVSHIGALSRSQVNQAAKIVSSWCVRLIPHPASGPAGAARRRSW
jgi:hypothetical protein